MDFSDMHFSMERQIHKRIAWHEMSCYHEQRTGDWEQCYLLNPILKGQLGFQTQKLRI